MATLLRWMAPRRFEITIGHKTAIFVFYVMPHAVVDCLMGIDLLRFLKSTFCFNSNTLHVPDSRVTFRLQPLQPRDTPALEWLPWYYPGSLRVPSIDGYETSADPRVMRQPAKPYYQVACTSLADHRTTTGRRPHPLRHFDARPCHPGTATPYPSQLPSHPSRS